MSQAPYPLAFCEANGVVRLEDREGRPVAGFSGEPEPGLARRLAFFHGEEPLLVRLDPSDFAVRIRKLGSFGGEEGGGGDAEEEDPSIAEVDASEPLVNYLDSLILDAARRGASDLHIEWGRPTARVRLRIDGVLRDAGGFPAARFAALSSRLKLLAGLDIVERRLPQDGRIPMDCPEGRLDIRASFLPAARGESIVLRLLSGERAIRSPDELGMPDALKESLLAMSRRPQGLILATGPTGSGKTTTLCALAGNLASRGQKVITIEDPVESALPGAVQVQVNEAAGLGFAGLLARVLRQDPDAIMVGEIRDAETAALALRAALTGHLVLSSLHTADAPGAVERLRDLGMPPYLCAATLRGVLAQRLVRRLCPSCGAAPGRAACPLCGGSGFSGRLALFELLDCGACSELISAGKSAAALRAWMASTGAPRLRDEGEEAIRKRLSSREEVEREVEL